MRRSYKQVRVAICKKASRGIRIFERLRGIPGIVNVYGWARLRADDTDSLVVLLVWKSRADAGGDLDSGVGHAQTMNSVKRALAKTSGCGGSPEALTVCRRMEERQKRVGYAT